MLRAHDFYPTRRDLLSAASLLLGRLALLNTQRQRTILVARRQASTHVQTFVRQHRCSDNSSYSSVGRFPHQLHGTPQHTTTTTTIIILPADINAKAFHRQNLRACTRSDCNARLGPWRLIFTPEPGIFPRPKRQRHPTTIHIPLLTTSGGDGGARTCILYFIFCTSNSGTEEK